MNAWDIATKTVLITGASSGIGKALAKRLAGVGAKVIIHCRNEEKCRKTREEIIREIGNEKIDYITADLSSMRQVAEMAKKIEEKYRNLHVLVNNAGVYNDKRKITEDGFEETLAVNYLAPFLLTRLLLDMMKKSAPARIINVTSELYKKGKINYEDFQLEKNYTGMKAYSRSKLALTMFTIELAERLEGTGVTVNCYSPGLVKTKLGSRGGTISKLGWKLVTLFGRSPDKGAETGFYLATDPSLSKITGKHFRDLKMVETTPITRNKKERTKLWKETEKILEKFLGDKWD